MTSYTKGILQTRPSNMAVSASPRGGDSTSRSSGFRTEMARTTFDARKREASNKTRFERAYLGGNPSPGPEDRHSLVNLSTPEPASEPIVNAPLRVVRECCADGDIVAPRRKVLTAPGGERTNTTFLRASS